MSRRIAFLSSTFISTLIAGAALGAEAPPSTRAVDTINGSFEAFGGSYATSGIYAAAGKLSVPIGQQFGLQLDASAGSFANRFLGTAGGHLFWRDPRTGLIGLYGDHQHWDQYGGVDVNHVGAEGEAYLGRFTLHGVVGAEFGNNASVLVGNTTINTNINGSVFTTNTGGVLADKTRLFDRISLSYYVTDDWKATIGHRYVGGKNLLALGTEYAMPLGRGVMTSAFAEARVGEGHDNYGLWGGLRFYFGQKDKSLIRRHREDDPGSDNSPDTMFSIANSLGPNSTTQSNTCLPGEAVVNGSCQLQISDRRIKRDVVLLVRLDNGIGLYRFRYLWSDAEYVGVMAQEVLDVRPDAVLLAADGYFRVNYGRLGLRMMTWAEWCADEGVQPLAA